jgi:uncharacterized protein with GYD domain
LALGVRGDGADFPDGFAELAVVELLAAGGIKNFDQTADLVGAVAARLDKTGFLKSGVAFTRGNYRLCDVLMQDPGFPIRRWKIVVCPCYCL